MPLTLIVAVAENNVIGRQGDLPWRLSADLRRFKRLTMGHAILMGRKTWESIGRPLPGRTSVVITRQTDYQPGFEEVLVAADLDEALTLAQGADVSDDQAFVIGGAAIYELSLPRADRLLLTRVHAEVEGDVFFPEVDWSQWRLVSEEKHDQDDKNDFSFSFQNFKRVEA
ncbi:MAG: dihydrofolate reductase [Planctomycetes bacterium]|nr:dihydrofolate reductase [Planctomycetota bacterium]